MERARVAVERTAAGLPLDAEAIADVPMPEPDPAVPARLDELLPGDGPLAGRIAAYRASVRIPPDNLAQAATRILDLLSGRAVEDLDLPDEAQPPLAVSVGRLGGEAMAVVGHEPRVVVDDASAWTPDELAAELARHVVPGRWLAARLRGVVTVEPSPATTVDRGRESVGREVLLADHELSHELTRLGRRLGARWNGDRMLLVRRALDDRAAAVAAVALAAEPGPRPTMAELGFDELEARRMVAGWAEPMARVDALASAAGPPLVRAWLTTQGQTAGLRRLLHEPLVPTELRADLEVAGA